MNLLVLFGIIVVLGFGEAARSSKKTSSHTKQGGEDTKKTLEKIRLGAVAGSEILNALNSLNGTFKVGKIAKVANFSGKVGPFLAAVGPMILFINEFLPSGNTQEMQEIKAMFDNVQKRFDQVFNQFNEVNELLNETSLAEMYSSYEHNIIYYGDAARKYFTTNNTFERMLYKDRLIYDGEKTSSALVKAVWALYYGLTATPVFNMNIPTTVLRYTNNHRNKTEHVINGVSLLITDGLFALTTINELMNKTERNSVLNDYWATNMDNVTRIITAMNELAVANLKMQYVKDIESLLTKTLQQMTNKALADKIFDFLQEKYDWMDWFVLAFAYSDIKSKGGCDEVLFRQKKADMNVMVVYIPKEKPIAINKGNIMSHMRNVKGTTCFQRCHFDLREPYAALPTNVKNGCTIPGVIGFAEKSNSYGSSYRVTNPARLLELKYGLNGGIKFYIFG